MELILFGNNNCKMKNSGDTYMAQCNWDLLFFYLSVLVANCILQQLDSYDEKKDGMVY